MSFLWQVLAVYFGVLVLLTCVGSVCGLAIKYKIQPLGAPMIVAFGLLLMTAGVAVWYFVERKP